MKKKTLISIMAVLMSLFVGLFCSSCFADTPDGSDGNSAGQTDSLPTSETPIESPKDSESGEHTHTLTKVAAVEATCLKAGNIEYYTCTCGKLFADKDGKQETTPEAVQTTGTHNYEAKAAKEPTYYEEGIAAHYACSVCKKLFLQEDGEYVEKQASELAIAKKKIADETKPSVVDETSDDLINKAVTDKVKEVDQAEPTFVKILNKDGVEVQAIYLSRSDAWVGNSADGNNNYSYSEFRIAVSGKITAISFEYKLVDFNDDDICNCTGLNPDDKNLGMKSFLEYKHHSGNYTNETREEIGVRCFVADGEWHTFTFAHEMDEMQNILFKIHHFVGEFVVTNIKVTAPHVHDLNKVDGKDATCTENGNKEYYICNECGLMFADAEASYEIKPESVVIAKGHRYKSQAEKGATYYEEGVKAHYSCEKCSKLFVKSGEEYTETTADALVIPKKKIKDETTDSVVDPSSSDLINQAVADKVKQVEQTVPTFVKILNKNGVEVQAIYLSRTAGWGENVANGDNNYSFSEFRIPVSGKIASISFEYKLVDFNPNDTCACSGLTAGDKNLGMKSFLEYKHDNDYTNETRDTYGISCFVADGEWHTFSFDHEMSGMQNILFKIHHFQGEFVVTNIVVTLAHEHSYSDWTVTTAATCEAAGSKKRTCECGAEEVETINALGHDYVDHAAQAATCTEAGWNAYKTCNRCNYTNKTTIDALGHNYNSVDEVAATYYAEGVAYHFTCDRCNKLFVLSGEAYVETTAEALKISRKTILEETTASVRNTESDDFINTIVDGKLKFLDQTQETGTKFVTTADKNGDQVLAAYFSNSTAWSEADDRVDDGNNNWGFGEFRIALSGNITKISFEYRMWDVGNGVCQYFGPGTEPDKSYLMKHVIEYSDAAGYRNESKAVYGDRFLIADGEWHTFTLEANGTGMKNVLLKMYHFTGEMLVTNYKVGRNFLSECTDAERGTGADYINTIVDAKLKYLDQTPTTGTKFVTTADKSGNQVLAAYFSNSTAWSEAKDRVDDGNNNWGFGEFRIALNKENITKISFEYKMWDFGNGVCQYIGDPENPDKSYLMKHVIEYSDAAGYRNESKAVYGDRFLIADGEWHTFTLEANGTGMKNVLLKMYHFTGEMLVTNYTVTVAE